MAAEIKEKTNTKTLEIKGGPTTVEEKSASLNDGSDPRLKNNKADEEKKQKHTKILLHAREEIAKAESANDDEGIEFTAKTAVFSLPDEIRASLSVAQAPALEALKGQAQASPKANLSQEQAELIKEKVKAHYQKKALLLEVEVNKILESFKSTNPAVNKRIDLVKKLLARHAGKE